MLVRIEMDQIDQHQRHKAFYEPTGLSYLTHASKQRRADVVVKSCKWSGQELSFRSRQVTLLFCPTLFCPTALPSAATPVEQ